MRDYRLMALPFPALRHFSVIEFARADLMDNAFLQFLDEVRHKAGVPFKLTSDARTAEHNKQVGGAPTSLHLLGRAVDFTLRAWDSQTLWKITWAVCHTPTPNGCGIELEFVIADQHCHLGLMPDTRPSREYPSSRVSWGVSVPLPSSP